MKAALTILLTILFLYTQGQNNHWLQTFGSIQSDLPTTIKVDSFDNIVVTGKVGASAVVTFNNTSLVTDGADGKAFIYKQDSSNNLIWFKQIGGSKGKVEI